MPVALHLRFPAGRYHATGWGHHVNEAALDWPPAPFRLLRALYAQAFRLPERPERERLASLFGKLARPPASRLPLAPLFRALVLGAVGLIAATKGFFLAGAMLP